MTSLVKEFKSNHLGNVLTVKCNNIFDALYAVKNAKKIYFNPVLKWDLSSCKESDEYSTSINYYKSKMGCTNLYNPKALEKDIYKSASLYLKKARIQLFDENNEKLSENDINKKCKFIIYKNNKWHAVLMLNQEGSIDSKEMKKIETDFSKHLSIIEKEQISKDKSKNDKKQVFVKIVESLIEKNSKNVGRVQKHEKTINDKKKELEEYYLKNLADKRMKDETVFNTKEFKEWYIVQKKSFLQEGGMKTTQQRIDERKRLMMMIDPKTIVKKNQELRLQNKRKQARKEELKIRRYNLNYFDDFLYKDLFENLFYTNYKKLIIKEDEIYNVLMQLLITINDNTYNVLTPTTPTTQISPTSNYKALDNVPVLKKRTMVYGGKKDNYEITNEQENIKYKVFNDFFHDFDPRKGGRNPNGVDNRSDYINAFQLLYNEQIPEILKKKYHVNEDRYMKYVLENIEPQLYEEFVLGNYNDLDKIAEGKLNPNSHPIINAINSFRITKLNNNKLIVIEDTYLTSRLKTPSELDSLNTYTNILDPITNIKTENGSTEKINRLVYDKFKDKYYDINEKILDVYQEEFDKITLEFFNSLKSPHTWNIELFRIPFDFKIDLEDVNNYYSFKVNILFVNKQPLIFNIYGGMFTVDRINDLIGWVKSGDKNRTKYETNIEKKLDATGSLSIKNRKLWYSILRFYKELVTTISLSNQNAVLFIQMMKAFGDHAQIKEFRLLSHDFDGGNKNLIFASIDRIIIAEAFRLNCPVIFQFGSMKNKFPQQILDNIFETSENQSFELDTSDKHLYFNPHNAGDVIFLSKILYDNGIITYDNGIKYHKNNNLLFIEGDVQITEDKLRELLQSVKTNDILTEFNIKLIQDFIKSILNDNTFLNKTNINIFLKIIVQYNRVKMNLYNRLLKINNRTDRDIFHDKMEKLKILFLKLKNMIELSTSSGRRQSNNKTKFLLNSISELQTKFNDYKELINTNKLNVNVFKSHGSLEVFESDFLFQNPYYTQFLNILLDMLKTPENIDLFNTFNSEGKSARQISEIEDQINESYTNLLSKITQ